MNLLNILRSLKGDDGSPLQGSGDQVEPEDERLPDYFQKVPIEFNHFPLGVVWWLARIADGVAAKQARRTYELFEHKWKGPDGDEWRAAGQKVLTERVGRSETSDVEACRTP